MLEGWRDQQLSRNLSKDTIYSARELRAGLRHSAEFRPRTRQRPFVQGTFRCVAVPSDATNPETGQRVRCQE
jgi:hypothetical protein